MQITSHVYAGEATLDFCIKEEICAVVHLAPMKSDAFLDESIKYFWVCAQQTGQNLITLILNLYPFINSACAEKRKILLLDDHYSVSIAVLVGYYLRRIYVLRRPTTTKMQKIINFIKDKSSVHLPAEFMQQLFIYEQILRQETGAPLLEFQKPMAIEYQRAEYQTSVSLD